MQLLFSCQWEVGNYLNGHPVVILRFWTSEKQLDTNVTLLIDIPVHFIADVERGEDGRHRYLSQPKTLSHICTSQ